MIIKGSDLSEDRSEPLIIINPSYTVLDDTLEVSKEGCLSIPTFNKKYPEQKR